MGFMVKPFWVDAGFTAAQIGLSASTSGSGCRSWAGWSAAGTRPARHLPRPVGAGLWQAASNLGYAVAAGRAAADAGRRRRDGVVPEHQAMVYAASALESLTGGLGTGAFLAFLMAITSKARATTEYAILSSIFALQPRRGGLGRRHRRAGAGLRALVLPDVLALRSRPICCCRRYAACWNGKPPPES